jgi:hypothetical protein
MGIVGLYHVPSLTSMILSFRRPNVKICLESQYELFSLLLDLFKIDCVQWRRNMMNPCPILPTEPGKPKPSMVTESPGDFPPPLWSQIDPASRRQLAQQIAELIRRIRLPNPQMEVRNHEPG